MTERTDKNLAYISKLLKTIPTPLYPSRFAMRDESAPDTLPQNGEVWLTACDEEEWTLQVIIVGAVEYRGLALVVPVLPHPEEAGPEDRILPGEVMGYDAYISFELMATLPYASLIKCVGNLAVRDYEEVEQVMRIWEGSEWKVGMTYIDESDHRYGIHVDICERMGRLQESILDGVTP
jgi:hypothetical protein